MTVSLRTLPSATLVLVRVVLSMRISRPAPSRTDWLGIDDTADVLQVCPGLGIDAAGR